MEASCSWDRCPPPREGRSASASRTLFGSSRHTNTDNNTSSQAGTGFSAGGGGRDKPAHLALIRLRAGDIELNPGPINRGEADNPVCTASRGDRRRQPARRDLRGTGRKGGPGDLRIMQLNCNGIWPRLTELRSRLGSERPHLVLLQETKLRAGQEAPTFPGYNIAARQDWGPAPGPPPDVTAPPAPPTPPPTRPPAETLEGAVASITTTTTTTMQAGQGAGHSVRMAPRTQGGPEARTDPPPDTCSQEPAGRPKKIGRSGAGGAGGTGGAISAGHRHLGRRTWRQPQR